MPAAEEYTAFPVAPGQVWVVGEHEFSCGDLRSIGAAPDCDLLYSDPPWGNALLRTFHDKAGMERPDYEWDLLYETILTSAAPDVPVWLEGGTRQLDRIIELARGRGMWVESFDITYYSRRPAVLVYSGPGRPSCNPSGMDDEDTPGFVMRSLGSSGTVYDPCLGRGCTATSAHAVGWRCIGNELNPRRLSAALARLAQLSGIEPRRVV